MQIQDKHMITIFANCYIKDLKLFIELILQFAAETLDSGSIDEAYPI